jgi:hypothetical protein
MRQRSPGLLALLAAALLIGCVEGDAYDGARQDCVDQINAYRATVSLPPLERWTSAEECSDGEADSDSETGAAHGAFGTCGVSAQNECPGWGSVESITTGCLAMMWAGGPGEPYSEHGHYLNMTNPSCTRVACGFHVTPEGSVWAVQSFQ